MTADQSLDVEITPRSAPAGVAGIYRATFTASASCTSLPADLRTRTYTARIDQDAARLLDHAERCLVCHCAKHLLGEECLATR